MAEWPGPCGSRLKAGERKKFCMSITRRAVLLGSRAMGVVVVLRLLLLAWRVRRGWIGGEVGVGGCVRS